MRIVLGLFLGIEFGSDMVFCDERCFYLDWFENFY